MKIADFDLDQKVMVVAEIGNNHEGDFALAERLIREAAKARADAVKFQTIIPEKLVSLKETARIEQLRRFQLSYEQFQKLSKVAKEENVLFLATPFDIESVHFLKPLVPAFKVASGDNNFFPMIETIAKTGKPIILSSGMTDLDQIKQTKDFIQAVWEQESIRTELAILHCVVSYPTEDSDANLLAIRALQKLSVAVGYSDHTLGIEAALLAVGLGARIVEKHFTISKNHSEFQDHKISADPKEFADLVRQIRRASELLGNGIKCLQNKEKAMVEKVRRSIVTCRDLKKGSVVAWEDLSWVRPAVGLPPGEEKKVIGKTLKRTLSAGEPILLSDLE